MLFNSIQFLIFFPIVTIIYFCLPFKYRWLHLLAASCIFYAAFIPIYILILFFTIIIDYYAGIIIENSTDTKRKNFLIISLVANIGILAIFKYYNFFVENINETFLTLDITYALPLLKIILPIGLSFHTFQAMSYTIEVYRGNQKAERHFGIYSLYVMYYPQLVAGPIERPQNILHQFKINHQFNVQRACSGLQLMIWGMFKKVVIADRLSLFVNEYYNHPDDFNGLSTIITCIFFSFQIYCDFSGYSDIAIGASRVMGIDLMKNFKQPYLASSISEFWKRWHISLSTWFRDYLYISLGGNRVAYWRWNLNLLIVFIVSGFWHGANWTFLIWGFLHGIFLIFENIFNKYYNINPLDNQNRIKPFFKILGTFLLVSFAWIFFRAPTLSIATNVVKRIFSGWCEILRIDFDMNRYIYINQTTFSFWLALILIGLLLLVEYTQNSKYSLTVLKIFKNPIINYLVFFILIFAIYSIGVFNQSSFIYFQF